MKIYLKQLFSELSHNQNSNVISFTNVSVNNKLSSNRLTNNGKPDLILNYDKIPLKLKIVEIKNFIADNMKCRIENINIYINAFGDIDNSYGLSDDFDVIKIINSNKTLTTSFLSISNNIGNSILNNIDNFLPTLYFKINKDIAMCKIIIEYFLKNIDKILMTVSLNCSIYMLKYIIRGKLGIPEDEQILIDLNSQKIFKNNEIINNILSLNKEIIGLSHNLNSNGHMTTTFSAKRKEDYLNSGNFSINDGSFCFNKLLRIQLIRKGKKKCAIGIDFSFNLLQNITKIDFSKEAPSFREASDGINIFCYCRNKQCKIENEMFVNNLGFGKFEILREIAFIRCPNCNTYQIDCKNIGFINCEWYYRGILSANKNCCISGDGVTIDNKLYILKEVSLKESVERLEFQIKEKKIPKNRNNILILNEINEREFQTNISEKNYKNGENSFSNLDSIGLESIKSKILNSENSKFEDFELIDLKLSQKNHIVLNNSNIFDIDNNFFNDSNFKNLNKSLKKKSCLYSSINDHLSVNKSIFDENFKHTYNSFGISNINNNLLSSNYEKSFELNSNNENSAIKNLSPVINKENSINKINNLNNNSILNDRLNNNNNQTNKDNFAINIIQDEKQNIKIDLEKTSNDFYIERSAICINESCLSFFSKKKNINNNKSCSLF